MSCSLKSISKCSELSKSTTPPDNDSHPLLQLPVEIWTGFIFPHLGVEESRALLRTCRMLHYLVCQSLEHAYDASHRTPQRLLPHNILQDHPNLSYRIERALSDELSLSDISLAFLKSLSPHTEQGQQALDLGVLADHAWNQLQRRILISNTMLLKPYEFPPHPYTYETFVTWCAQHVEILSASYLNLATIPEAISRFTLLQRCNLGHNLIPSIPPGIFSRLEWLKTIHLCDNLLQTLPPNTFSGVPRLQAIDLSSNYLSSLPPDIFSTLTQLAQINLSGNRFRALPSDCFLGLRWLISVRLSENQLKEIPHLDCPNLQALFLDNNLLCTLPSDTFSNFPKLAHIDLSGNALTECPRFNCPALERLFLQGNLLSTLPSDAFSNLQELVILDLSGNRLTSLPPGIFANLPHLEGLCLDNNPWQDFPLPEGTEGGFIYPQKIDLAQCSSAFRSLFEPRT